MRASHFALIIAIITASASAHSAPATPAPAPAPAPAAAGAPLTVDNRLSVVVRGSGPDVILIPGLASSRAVWDATVRQLSGHYRVHTVNVAGFAGEAAGANASGPVFAPLVEAVANYIATAKLKNPAIIGHSMGGEMALALAARHPASVGRVMIVDALPFFPLSFNPSATVEMARPQAEMMRDMFANMPADQADEMRAGTVARMVKTEGGRAPVIAWGKASEPKVVGDAVYDLMTTDLRGELGKITAPVTVVHAWDASMGVPAARLDGLFATAYAGVKSANVARIDGSYHFIMIDQPQAFADAVTAFLK